jgi:hypothetical protein
MSIQANSSLCILLCAVCGSPRKKSWRSFTRVLGLRNEVDATPLLLKETSMTTQTIPTGRKPACQLAF